jgi:hypothetical protein
MMNEHQNLDIEYQQIKKEKKSLLHSRNRLGGHLSLSVPSLYCTYSTFTFKSNSLKKR